MARKKTPNDLYWTAKEKTALRQRYEAFCAESEMPPSPHSAHLFAIRERNSGGSSLSEREIILAVQGQLPEHYD